MTQEHLTRRGFVGFGAVATLTALGGFSLPSLVEPTIAEAYTLQSYCQKVFTIYYTFDSSTNWSDSTGKMLKNGYNHAISAWNNALKNKTVTKYGKAYRYEFKPADKNNAATVTLCQHSKADGNAGIAPITYTSSGWITKAKTYINTKYIKDLSSAKYVACHELGHVLGIDHGGKSAVMYYRENRITKPTTDDINAAYANLKKTVAYAVPKPKPKQVPGTRKNNKGLCYFGHVQNAGDMGFVYDGQTAGTIGYSARLENFMFASIPSTIARLDVEVHVQKKGWLKYTKVKTGQKLGTSGQSLRIEAVRIKAYDKDGKVVNINYQIHQQNYGWSATKKNGAQAGITGKSLRIEAIRICLP